MKQITLFSDIDFTESNEKDETKKSKIPDEKRLNNLTGKEWIKFSKSWFTLKRGGVTDREKIKAHPATFPAELAEDYIGFCTKQGERVLDPFLGSGTTMEVAEQMGRLSFGIELQPEFAEFAATRTSRRIVIGNALEEIHNAENFPDESIDYVFTSPPYWNTLHKSRGGNKDTRHKKREARGESLIYSDRPEDIGNIDDVDEYMSQLVSLFTGVHRVLKPNRYLTIIIQNLNYEGRLVPIAWQLGILLTETGMWKMKGERIWCKEQGRLGIYGYPTTYATNNFHHYCLTFQRR
jgi:DNA modification methylase